ncbi:UvrABC system protein A [Chlamydiales bacterium STE3]|nr:UvrABC system protein A [Chlamydiales bacterium STE3]
MNQQILLKKVKVHNLKSVDLALNPNQLIVFTGVSGSGKSSLAFDTLFAEGQRRYVESLSTFARRQINELAKPDIESASGISPTISIEQKTAGRNPRSTVGTLTEIYDYIRVLFARIGKPFCPVSGEPVSPQSRERIIKLAQILPEGTKLIILAPYSKGKKGEFKEDFQELVKKGFMRARVDGKIVHLDEEISLDGNLTHDVDVLIDRIVVKPENYSRIAESVTTALDFGKGLLSLLDADTDEEKLFSMHAYSPKSGLSYPSLEPHDFSFNSPSGMCSECHGLGYIQEFDLEKIIDPEKSIAEDCCLVGSSYQTVRYGNIYRNLATLYDFSVHTPWKALSQQARKVFLKGNDKKWTRMQFVHPLTGASWIDHIQWKGVLHEAKARLAEAKSEGYRNKMLKIMSEQCCPICQGSKLKPYPSAAKFAGKKIHEITQLTVRECLKLFQTVELPELEFKIAEELLKEIKERLNFLLEVGLHYLTLERRSPTLSGGEAQRVRLASQIGSGLVGITYILDEPSIGLHPRDNKKLLSTLKHLRDIGNTVIVVEHDEETIWESDYVVDFGPGAGKEGGEIVYQGPIEGLLKSQRSLTGAYLSGKKEISIPKKRKKKTRESLKIVKASHHNLKNIDVTLPLGLFVAITGVSGSGKSSLISDTLYPALSNHLHQSDLPVGKHHSIKGKEKIDKIIAIDQTPIGRNPRSNPATYIKLLDEIRALLSQLPESQAKGFTAGRFSFNVKEGSCSECHGMGQIKIDMDFLEDAWVDCPLCANQRFDPETLSIFYKGKNIYDILEMDVDQAHAFFKNIPSINRKLSTLQEVGLGYLKIGQPSTTLSGGEAQRIKLAKELVRPSTGQTLYILDEPSTGLHFHDIHHLLNVLHKLVELGNSVVVIEHNMDIVKTADWIIDLGPEGGYEGGQLVGEGPPETISKMDTPTGKAVSDALNQHAQDKIRLLEDKEKASPNTIPKPIQNVSVKGAEQNNLKHLDISFPREKITICTGPSGSGKTSFAFDTVYAEGQRRYIESLSPYARQFVKQMSKPKAGLIEGLSPAIAIEQKSHAGNPRSTVGTMTEIYDYLRLMYARLGVPHDPETGEVIQSISKSYVAQKLLELPENEKIQILAPIEIKKNEKFADVINRLRRQGFLRIRLNGEYHDLEEPLTEEIFDRKRKNEFFLVIDRLKITPSIEQRLLEAIQAASDLGNNQLTVARENGKDLFFNLAFAVASTGRSFTEITPHTFAFNKPEGMCPECLGLGYTYGANLMSKPELLHLSAISLLRFLWAGTYDWQPFIISFLDDLGIDPHIPLNDLTSKQLHHFLNGSLTEIETKSGLRLRWQGINTSLVKAGRNARNEVKERILPLLDEDTCSACEGDRLNPLARNVTLIGFTIGQLCHMPVLQTLEVIKNIAIDKANRLLEDVQNQLVSRLQFLNEVGLEYIALDRKAPSLSGGEAQRIRLARQLGSGLTGVLYVLDEPTIGLHPHDNEKLNRALQKLKQLKNTLLMVEHDPLSIACADHIIDFGPGSGSHGGHVTAQGTYEEILKDPHSLTGKYLSHQIEVPRPNQRRQSKEFLKIRHAKSNNLKDLSLDIPIGALTCFTGVSGSGKSTLLHDVVFQAVQKGLLQSDKVTLKGIAQVSGIHHFEKLLFIDQNPIGHTIRSDIATYTEILTPIRELFASIPEAAARGLQPKNFSYNHRRGMCTNCWGLGFKKVSMHFLPPVKVVCDECQGLRLNKLSLTIHYKEKNLGQLLNYTIDELKIFFANHFRIIRILDTLISVGLGYLRLGQEMVSLSGGEAQRIKLSRELSKRSRGKTLYLLDEPTTGLHSDDIVKLLKVLHQLIDKGNTMVMIEHNLDMIKNADYIFDIGPGSGEMGGSIIAQGSPEQLIKNENSFTAHYLTTVI